MKEVLVVLALFALSFVAACYAPPLCWLAPWSALFIFLALRLRFKFARKFSSSKSVEKSEPKK